MSRHLLRFVPLLVACLVTTAAAQPPARVTRPPDPLGEARQLYNLGRYEAAMAAADGLRDEWQTRHAAHLIYGRAAIERFRQTADAADLAKGRDALRAVDASRLDARDRLDLIVGLGQALYFDGQYRVAAEVFTSALDQAHTLGPAARDQLLDWWATSLDRFAQARPPADRAGVYERIVAQMDAELRRDAGAGSASYWMAAAWRGRGDLERAWDAALAAWVRAQLTRDRGAGMRSDLDQLVRDAIIPDRARRMPPPSDPDQAATAMLAEWELFKEKWAPSPP